ncbi:hypothetical protein BC831DRAFT_164348 [Entophlyctis helioformis]|nr:hypothetical protein BC831DRAFT_164348 [Entophlyctis helioformis]
MFKNDFQGGPSFEVFSSQGSAQSLLNWKVLHKGFVKRQYEKNLKGFCHYCENLGRLTLPKDDKQHAYLIQPFVVMQIFSPAGQPLSIELLITDLNQNHRRFFISTAHRELKVTALHCGIPLVNIKRGVWINLCLDMVSLVSDNYRGQMFRSLDGISILGTFRLRRVFTLKNQPPDTTGDDFQEPITFHYNNVEAIPSSLNFPYGVNHMTQVINMHRVLHALAEHAAIKENHMHQSEAAALPQQSGSSGSILPQIAFGRTIDMPLRPPGGSKTKARVLSAHSAASQRSQSGRAALQGKSVHMPPIKAESPVLTESHRSLSRTSAHSDVSQATNALSTSHSLVGKQAKLPPINQHQRSATQLPQVDECDEEHALPATRSAALSSRRQGLSKTREKAQSPVVSAAAIATKAKPSPEIATAAEPEQPPSSSSGDRWGGSMLPRLKKGESSQQMTDGVSNTALASHIRILGGKTSNLVGGYNPDLYTDDNEELGGWSSFQSDDAVTEPARATLSAPRLFEQNAAVDDDRDALTPAERLQREIDTFLSKSSLNSNSMLLGPAEDKNGDAKVEDDQDGTHADGFATQDGHAAPAFEKISAVLPSVAGATIQILPVPETRSLHNYATSPTPAALSSRSSVLANSSQPAPPAFDSTALAG